MHCLLLTNFFSLCNRETGDDDRANGNHSRADLFLATSSNPSLTSIPSFEEKNNTRKFGGKKNVWSRLHAIRNMLIVIFHEDIAFLSYSLTSCFL